MKKFLKKVEGFTLVELIVVIAILGILTAIAVPVYSGYVKKASEAGDTQTLSAMNTAIAAAMTENDVEFTKANVEKYLDITDDNSAATAGCNVTVAKKAAEGELSEEILKDFQTYYGSTGSIKFAYYNGVEVPAGATNGNLVGKAPTA